MRLPSFAKASIGALALFSSIPSSHGISLDLTSDDSIKKAASTIAAEMMTYYSGNLPGNTPGILPGPYYWWECGAMMGSLIDYWYYTGDSKYNKIVDQALLFQLSDTYDYMPPNQTKNEGNDDQVFWGFAALSAAEYKFPEPSDPTKPSWVAQAQAVFNSQAARWDAADCGGGLRWQIFVWNNGYNYKNSASNGGLINLGARLYAYTGNKTYADWVEKTWTWMDNSTGVGLISQSYDVYDGAQIAANCTNPDPTQWTYSAGMLMNAAATMWNVTQSDVWRARAEGMWNRSSQIFFNEQQVMFEICEPTNNCNVDQLSFKAYFARWMAASTKVAPWLYDSVKTYLAASATAAAAQCNSGAAGTSCGQKWTLNGTNDGKFGVGQQMTALEVISGNLIQKSYAPVTESNGGLSKSNASFGNGGDQSTPVVYKPITTADRAGAGVVTAIVLAMTMGGGWFMVSP